MGTIDQKALFFTESPFHTEFNSVQVDQTKSNSVGTTKVQQSCDTFPATLLYYIKIIFYCVPFWLQSLSLTLTSNPGLNKFVKLTLLILSRMCQFVNSRSYIIASYSLLNAVKGTKFGES